MFQLSPDLRSEKPAVSVIVPCYKTERWLPACMDSLLKQTCSDAEFICIDDGSPDNCGAVLEEYAKKDSRVKVIHRENAGPSAARNAGLEAARGEYVAFLDSDDYFVPNAIKSMLKRARETDADLVFANSKSCSEDDDTPYGNPFLINFRVMPGTQPFRAEDCADTVFQLTLPVIWGILFKKSLIDNAGLRFPPLKRNEDVPFFTAAVIRAKKIAVLTEITVIHRQNYSGLEASKDDGPLIFLDAFRFAYEDLLANGVWETYRESFLRRLSESTRYSLMTFRQPDSFAKLCAAFRKEAVPLYELDTRPPRIWDDTRYIPVRLAAVSETPEELAFALFAHTDELYVENRKQFIELRRYEQSRAYRPVKKLLALIGR